MAWNDDKIRIMGVLWRSNWSVAAIAVALDMTKGAISGKIYRFRQAGDPGVLQGDLIRAMSNRAKLPPITADQARALLREPGYRDGLIKSLKLAEAA